MSIVGHQSLSAGNDVGAAEHVFVDGLFQSNVDVIGNSGTADGGNAAVQRLGRPPVAQQCAVGDAKLIKAVAQPPIGEHEVQMDMAVDQSGQNGVPGQVKDRILGPRLGQDTLVHFSHILHHVLIEFVLYIVKDIEAVFNGRCAGSIHDADIFQIGA